MGLILAEGVQGFAGLSVAGGDVVENVLVLATRLV